MSRNPKEEGSWWWTSNSDERGSSGWAAKAQQSMVSPLPKDAAWGEARNEFRLLSDEAPATSYFFKIDSRCPWHRGWAGCGEVGMFFVVCTRTICIYIYIYHIYVYILYTYLHIYIYIYISPSPPSLRQKTIKHNTRPMLAPRLRHAFAPIACHVHSRILRYVDAGNAQELIPPYYRQKHRPQLNFSQAAKSLSSSTVAQLRYVELSVLQTLSCSVAQSLFAFFLVAAPLKMVFPKKGSLFSQGH